MQRTCLTNWWITAVAIAVMTAGAHAVVFNLSSNNSTATFDTDAGGLTSWVVDGVDHLGGGGEMSWLFNVNGSPEMSLGTQPLNSSFQGAPDFAFAQYQHTSGGDAFTVDLLVNLLGGTPGSGISSLTVTPTARLVSGNNLDISLFEFVNANLTGTAAGDNGSLTFNNFSADAMQMDAQTILNQSINGGQLAFAPPAHASYDDASNLTGDFADASPTVLDDVLSRNVSDDAFAFQYDFQLNTIQPPNEEFIATAITSVEPKPVGPGPGPGVIPEPGTAVLGFMAVVGLMAGRKRR